MLNVAQIIFIFRDRNFIDGTYILMVNNYVEIIGVLLATLWCSGVRSDTPNHSLEAGNVDSITTAKFAPPSILTSRVHVELETLHTSMRSDGLA